MADPALGHWTPQPAARRCTFAARASAGSVTGMSSSTAERFDPSSALSLSQFVRTSSDPETSTSPNTCGCRWTSLDEPAGNVVDIPSSVLGRHLRVEDDLQEEIAELVAIASESPPSIASRSSCDSSKR